MTFRPLVARLLITALTVCTASPAGAAEVRERRFAQGYGERDGRTLLADVYLPTGTGPFPGVLMIHGGGWISGSRLHMLVHANAVARAGYVVVAIDYRLAPRHRYPAQLEDCQLALQWMHEHAADLALDTQRIAAYGYSAGGHLACMLGLAPAPSSADGPAIPRVQAVVAGGAVADFEWIGESSVALVPVFGTTRRDGPEVYRLASPLHHASADDPPVFLYHGQADLLVPLATARRLHERLLELGVPGELCVRPALGHLSAFLDPAAPANAIQFLDKVLQAPADGDHGE